jgi:hypothetical protein
MSVSDKELIAIQDVTTAKEAWDRIKQAHKVEGIPEKLMLLNRLIDLRIEEGLSAQEYVNRFDSLVVDCAALGLGLDKTPELLALFFLRGLPKSLETFAQHLTLSYTDGNENRLTPQYVTTSLINHIRTQTSRADSQLGEDGDMRVDKVSAKKKGHFKAECRSLNGGNDRQGGSSRNRGAGSKHKANKATTVKGTDWRLSATYEPDGDSESEDDGAAALVAPADGWILASGASSHFVSDKSRIKDYEPYVTRVKVADQQIVHTVGRGTLRVRSIVEGVQHNITFSNVLYVPDFANLISVGRLTNLGADIRFTKHGCSIVMEGQTILQATKLRQNLWRLRFDYATANKQTSVETGHLACER